MNLREPFRCILVLGFVLLAPLFGQKVDLRFRLALGDPRFKDQTIDVGWGHLFYDIGLNRRVRDMSGLPSKSVVAVSVPKGRPSITVSRTLADYIIGIPAEERPAYPLIGLNFKTAPDPSRLMIANKPMKDPAWDLDFEDGDIVLSVDGRTFSDIEELLIYLAGIPWGGEARFRLLRTDVEETVVLKIEEPPREFRLSLKIVRP